MRRLFTPSLEHRWAKARARARGPLAEYYSGRLPTNSTRVEDLRLLAIDTETTGLDPNRDHLLSVGYVPVDGTTIMLGGAAGFVVRTSREVGQSATYHGLTDDIVAAGTALEEALPATLRALTSRVLLAHFARLVGTELGGHFLIHGGIDQGAALQGAAQLFDQELLGFGGHGGWPGVEQGGNISSLRRRMRHMQTTANQLMP